MKTIFCRLAVCATLWASVPTKAATTPKFTPAEAKAQAILRDVDAKMSKHKTMTADFVVVRLNKTRYTDFFKVMRPNYSFVEGRYLLEKTSVAERSGSDGKNFWIYPIPGEETGRYGKRPLEEDEKVVLLPSPGVFAPYAFFGVRYASQIEGIDHQWKYINERTWNGATYRVLQSDKKQYTESKTSYRITRQIFVGVDNVIQRQVDFLVTTNRKEKGRNIQTGHDLQLSNIRFDVPMTPQQFAVKVPEGVTQWTDEPEALLKEAKDAYTTK